MIISRGSKRQIQVDSKNNPGQKESRDVLNILGVGKKAGATEYIPMVMTAWGQDIDKVPSLEQFTVYKTNLREKQASGRTVFNITQNTQFTKEKVVTKEQAVGLLEKVFEKVKFTEYGTVAGNGKTYIVKGSVIRHMSSERDGRKFAVYGIRPDDMEDIEDLITTQGLTIWIDPVNMKWGSDSLLIFVGQFRKGKNEVVAMNADGVIPMVEYPLTEASSPQEPVDAFDAPTPTPAPAAKSAPAKPATKAESRKKNVEVFDNVKLVSSGDESDPFGN